MRVGEKRGLSPVIATVLLVAIAMVLAVVIFLWASYFVGESVEKNDVKVEQVCEDVRFVADAFGGDLYIENTGTVSIYGIEVRKESALGDVIDAIEFSDKNIAPGATSLALDLNSKVGAGDTILVIPILLGETASHRIIHVCDSDYGERIIVGT